MALHGQRDPIFRAEALAARFHRRGSAILITTPLSGWVVSGAALVVSAAMLYIACWGTLTRTVTVSGALVPGLGILRVFSPQQGIVTAKRFVLGDEVRRGQPL